MAWDLAIDSKAGDMTGGRVDKQDEIVQRIQTRLWRHLGEWFVNTDCGLPWYKGKSSLFPDQLTEHAALLGSKSTRMIDMWVRATIADTDGVLRIVSFASYFDATSRTYSIRVQIATDYGLPFIVVDRELSTLGPGGI